MARAPSYVLVCGVPMTADCWLMDWIHVQTFNHLIRQLSIQPFMCRLSELQNPDLKLSKDNSQSVRGD